MNILITLNTYIIHHILYYKAFQNMFSYFFNFTIIVALMSQSNAFTISSASSSHTISTSTINASIQTTSATTCLGMTSSVSRRGFLKSAMVSCGTVIQNSQAADMAADQVKDEGLHDMLELLVGGPDEAERGKSCLSEVINLSDTNNFQGMATYLPFELVERCISRQSGHRR